MNGCMKIGKNYQIKYPAGGIRENNFQVKIIRNAVKIRIAAMLTDGG